ncbi:MULTISPECIES: hypothetical protein [unclassified Streptomyces]|uniref:hypothetical protein n=1 Tax=unclassified Streptomyces TaxID=2593676 RepID=UPI001F03DEAF|nr:MULTISPECIES: hypothetical protein [unclassified Streptomyces]MCH0566574.1 hypothetical protein [Streptomyces sp. MUM 2J]MCH0573369.1 hypothetical protein [Streptomyces sp. MUM 136J]
MTDVVDADELMRRMQRARACAAEEARAWGGRRSGGLGAEEAAVRTVAYEVVVRVLDEILTPGARKGRV